MAVVIAGNTSAKMKILLSNKYKDCVELGRKSMLPYFQENGLKWDFDERLKIYVTLQLYEVIDEKFIGFMALREKDGKVWLADLQILEEFRNKGYGAKVLEYVKDIAKSKNYDSVYLKVFKSSPALNLYLRNGYKHVGEEEYVYHLSTNT